MQHSTFLHLPVEIRERVFEYVFGGSAEVRLPIAKDPIKRKKWQQQYQTYIPRRFRTTTRKESAIDDLDWRTEPTWSDHMVFTCREQPTVFLGLDGHSFSNTPLACINRQMRKEFGDYLNAYAAEVIAQVSNLDFHDIIHYLRRLPAAQQNGFAVSRHGTHGKLLRIELCGPYDENCGRNLEMWLGKVVEIVGSEGEFATAFKMNWPKQKNPKINLLQLPMSMLESAHTNRGEGSARLETHRILSAFHSTKNLAEYFHFSGGWRA